MRTYCTSLWVRAAQLLLPKTLLVHYLAEMHLNQLIATRPRVVSLHHHHHHIISLLSSRNLQHHYTELFEIKLLIIIAQSGVSLDASSVFKSFSHPSCVQNYSTLVVYGNCIIVNFISVFSIASKIINSFLESLFLLLFYTWYTYKSFFLLPLYFFLFRLILADPDFFIWCRILCCWI